MSTVLYGYIETESDADRPYLLRRMAHSVVAEISERSLSELYNWPFEWQPKENAFGFTVYDSKNKRSAEYLVDYVDYAPEAAIGLPTEKDARLRVFTNAIRDLLASKGVTRLLVAVTDCNQIEDSIEIHIDEFFDVLQRNLIENQPPNRLYIITRYKNSESSPTL